MTRRLPAIAGGIALPVPAAALTDDEVYCSRGRIEVDRRDPDRMRIARGTSICRIGPGSRTRADAETFARRGFGGAGGSRSSQ